MSAAVALPAVMSREEEHELAFRFRNGDSSAGAEMVNRSMGLVVTRAAAFVRNDAQGDLDLALLIDAGEAGLVEAIECFDPNRGTRLSTLAVPYIRGAISDEAKRQREQQRCEVPGDEIADGDLNALWDVAPYRMETGYGKVNTAGTEGEHSGDRPVDKYADEERPITCAEVVDVLRGEHPRGRRTAESIELDRRIVALRFRLGIFEAPPDTSWASKRIALGGLREWDEVGAILGVSEGLVRKRYHTIKQRALARRTEGEIQ